VIKRVIASNFRSLGENVAVELGPLTALVGVNGSGKSSVADVLQFVADCVNRGLDVAMTQRGGINALRRSGGGAIHIKVDVEIPEGAGVWEFSIGEGSRDDYRVLSERGTFNHRRAFTDVSDMTIVVQGGAGEEPVRTNAEDLFKTVLNPWFERDGENLTSFFGEATAPRTEPHSLLLPQRMAPVFRPLIEALRGVAIYKVFPNRLREPQKLDFAKPMREHGENWASILRSLDAESSGRDLVAALGHIVGDIDDYRTTAVGGFVIPEFRHRTEDGTATWLGASQESDGTLRMAGILTALLQEPPLTLIGIEEPELTVHPGAIGILFDHFREASARSQILLTTHSSELLDLLDIDEIRVVERRDNVTTVSRVDEAQRSLVKKRLATTSELIWSEGLRGATGTDGRG